MERKEERQGSKGKRFSTTECESNPHCGCNKKTSFPKSQIVSLSSISFFPSLDSLFSLSLPHTDSLLLSLSLSLPPSLIFFPILRSNSFLSLPIILCVFLILSFPQSLISFSLFFSHFFSFSPLSLFLSSSPSLLFIPSPFLVFLFLSPLSNLSTILSLSSNTLPILPLSLFSSLSLTSPKERDRSFTPYHPLGKRVSHANVFNGREHSRALTCLKHFSLFKVLYIRRGSQDTSVQP